MALRQVFSGGSGHFDLRPLCIKGDIKNIKEYWNRFCDQLDQKQGKDSTTPLHEAIKGGHFEVVEFLLYRGAQVSLTTSTGKTALYLASESAYIDIELLLIHYGAQLEYEFGSRQFSCYDTNDGPSLRILTELDDKLPLSQKPHLVKRCLLAAARLEFIEVMERLVQKDTASLAAAIKEAEDNKRHKSIAFLKLVQSAVEGDSELVSRLYGNANKGSITTEVRASVLKLPTRVPLELASAHSNRLIYREILVHTKLSRIQKGLEVDWSGLGVTDASISDLYVLQKIASVSVLSLGQNHLTCIEENFEVLSRLTVLDLSSNRLTHVHPVLFSLPSLWSLNLSNNMLSRLPLLTEPQYTLTHLDISLNKFNQVPFVVEKLHHLSYLNISHNVHIESLPMWFSSLDSLDDLRVEGLTNLDFRLKDSSTQGALKLLQTQSENSRSFYEMKMIVTGIAGSGKSSLVSKIRGATRQQTTLSASPLPPTGISISNWLYRLSEESREYEFIVWDVGSLSHTEIGVALEEIFYTPFAMYLIVFNLNTFKQDSAEIKQRLDAIARHSSPSCVLFVGTHLDLIQEHFKSYLVQETEKSLKHFLSAHPKKLVTGKNLLVTVSLASGHSEDIENVCQSIFNLASNLYCHDGQKYMGRKVLLSGLGLKGEVEEHCRQAYQGAKPPVLTYEEIQKMVSNLKDVDVQSHDELENISQFLNQVGCLLHFDVRACPDTEVTDSSNYACDLRDIYFMDPHWLYDKVRLIFAQLQSSQKSLIHHNDLTKCFLEQDTSSISNNVTIDQSTFLVPIVALLIHKKLLVSLKEGYLWYTSPFLLIDNISQETRDSLTVIPYSYCQQYEHKEVKTMWMTFLMLVLKMVTPLPDAVEEINRQRVVCWKSGVAWSSNSTDNKDGLLIEEIDDNKVVIKYTRSLEYSSYMEDIADLANEHFPHTTAVSFHCTTCMSENSNQIQSFTLPVCIQALVTGDEFVSCSDGHDNRLGDVVPFLSIRPTHSMTQLNSELKQQRYFSSTSTYLVRYKAKFRGRKIFVLKYSMFSEKALRELSSKSLSLEHYNTPGLSNCDGRLLALAIDKTHALLVCEVPPLGTFSTDSQSDNPVIVNSCVLHRIAVQLAKALTQVPDCLPQTAITKLQFWTLNDKSIVHCSLVVSDRYLRLMLARSESDSNQFSDSRIDTWFYYMRNLIKSTQMSFPASTYYLAKFLRPGTVSELSLESLVNCFSSVSVQLIGDVQPISSLQTPIMASAVPSLFSGSSSSTGNTVADLWMSSLYEGREEMRISVYSIMTQTTKVFKVKSNPIEVLAVVVCSDHVWISTQLPNDIGCISIFNSSTKKLAHNVKMTGNAITCMERIGSVVCAGTKAGFLFIFPDNVYAVKKGDPKPRHKFISEGTITCLVSIGTRLYIAHANIICIFDPENMKFISSLNPSHVTPNEDLIGNLFLSQFQPLIYSVQFGSHTIKAWDVAEARHLYTINVQESLRGAGESPDATVTALTAAIDTVWVGLNTGHVLVYHDSDIVLCLRPYQGPVNFLSRFINGDGCMIISGGERYISPTHDEQIHKDPILVLWKAYPLNVLLQLRALEKSKGEYLNSFESVSSLINSEYGFQDPANMSKQMMSLDSEDPDSTTLSTSTEDSISVQLPNRLIVTIPACSAKSMESLISVLQSEGLQSVEDNMSIVYHYQMYDTLVNVTTDDDLLSYLELTDRPMLVFVLE